MRKNPKQNIRRGTCVVKAKNGTTENALVSWDVTDQDAAREGAAIDKLNAMRPDMSTSNNVTQQDRRANSKTAGRQDRMKCRQ